MHDVKKSLINFVFVCLLFAWVFLTSFVKFYYLFAKKLETISLKYKTISLSIMVSKKTQKFLYNTDKKIWHYNLYPTVI